MGNNAPRLGLQKMRFLSAIIITAIAGFAVNGCYASEKINPINKVMQRNQLQSEASRLVEEGMYDQAISKYRESIRPEYINADHEKAFSVGSITDTLKLQNRYQEALDEYRWFLRHDKSAESAMEQYQQIEALISFSKSGDPAPIYKYIENFVKSHSSELPPSAYHTQTSSYNVQLIFLYDAIGDYDAGIKYVDEIRDYLHGRYPEILRMNSSVESLEHSKKIGTIQDRKNRRGYEIIAEYLKVREAFAQDKAEGRKGSMKEGKPGRATLALIQSDYFPW